MSYQKGLSCDYPLAIVLCVLALSCGTWPLHELASQYSAGGIEHSFECMFLCELEDKRRKWEIELLNSMEQDDSHSPPGIDSNKLVSKIECLDLQAPKSPIQPQHFSSTSFLSHWPH